MRANFQNSPRNLQARERLSPNLQLVRPDQAEPAPHPVRSLKTLGVLSFT